MDLSAVILAGGKGARMDGQDKGLVQFQGRRMVEWPLDLVRPLASRVLISCNRNMTDYMPLADSVVCDRIAGLLGPLAGVHAAMQIVETKALLVLPCDTPLLTADLLEKLINTALENPAAIVHFIDEEGAHPLHAVIPMSLQQDLEDYLIDGGRGVQKWYARHNTLTIMVGKQESKALANMNTLLDLEERG